jgi:L-phenylalanine/L-methionine N-acetyltransferase
MNSSPDAPPSLHSRRGATIRPLEPSDADAMADLRSLPGVRWGTLSMPYQSRESVREWIESRDASMTALVAELEGRLIGAASVHQAKQRRSHTGSIGMLVHDAYRRRGVGAALLAALIDMADNWLNLKRLELTVYTDNAPAIALYEKFGFETEGLNRAYAFRDGVYVDALMMARIRGV